MKCSSYNNWMHAMCSIDNKSNHHFLIIVSPKYLPILLALMNFQGLLSKLYITINNYCNTSFTGLSLPKKLDRNIFWSIISKIKWLTSNTITTASVIEHPGLKVFRCLIESCIGCSKLIVEKYYGHAKFHQRPKIKLYTASQNKFSRVVSSFRKFRKIYT